MTAASAPSLAASQAGSSTLHLAAQAYSHLHGLAYARLAADLTITESSPNFEGLGRGAVVGRALMEVLPEFIGLEAAIAEVQQRRSPAVQLERVNRTQADGSIGYFDLHLVALPPGLLVIVEDVTGLAQLEQLVQQAHNELRLLYHEVEQLRAELHRLKDAQAGK